MLVMYTYTWKTSLPLFLCVATLISSLPISLSMLPEPKQQSHNNRQFLPITTLYRLFSLISHSQWNSRNFLFVMMTLRYFFILRIKWKCFQLNVWGREKIEQVFLNKFLRKYDGGEIEFKLLQKKAQMKIIQKILIHSRMQLLPLCAVIYFMIVDCKVQLLLFRREGLMFAACFVRTHIALVTIWWLWTSPKKREWRKVKCNKTAIKIH